MQLEKQRLSTYFAEGEISVFKDLLKRKKLPFLGEFTDAFFTTLPFFGMYSTLSLTIILYAQTKDWLLIWFPWINLWTFMLVVGSALVIALLLAYKYIVPSLWDSRSKQMSHLEQKLDMISKKLNELDKKISNTSKEQ